MNNTPERWLPIPGYEDLYDISDQGRVRSWMPWNRAPAPRFLKPAPSGKAGHLAVSLTPCSGPRGPRGGRRATTVKVHQLVMLAFVGPRPHELDTRHLDGDVRNNHIANLAYGTRSENVLDSVRHGTCANGNTGKTHCKRGHLFDDENTDPYQGKRHCRACKREADIAALPSRREYFRNYMRAKRAASRAS